MKKLCYTAIILSLTAACQPSSDKDAQDNTTSTAPQIADDPAAKESFKTSFIGKYALEDGCEASKPTIEFTQNTLNWGETSCSIGGFEFSEDGLVQFQATECIAEGEKQDARSFTVEASGMMGIEIRSGEDTVNVKRCEAYEG